MRHRLHTFLSNFFYGYDTNDRGQKYPNENDLNVTKDIIKSTEYNSITKYNFVENKTVSNGVI